MANLSSSGKSVTRNGVNVTYKITCTVTGYTYYVQLRCSDGNYTSSAGYTDHTVSHTMTRTVNSPGAGSATLWARPYHQNDKGGSMTASSGQVTYSFSWSALSITLTFNPGENGTVAITSQPASYGSALGPLPTPSKENYSFLGWFTDETAGTQVTAETVSDFTVNTTLYAHWEANEVENTIIYNGNIIQLPDTISIPYNITYNNSTIYTVNGADYVTLLTAGKKALYDIMLGPNVALKCQNKYFLSNINIKTNANSASGATIGDVFLYSLGGESVTVKDGDTVIGTVTLNSSGFGYYNVELNKELTFVFNSSGATRTATITKTGDIVRGATTIARSDSSAGTSFTLYRNNWSGTTQDTRTDVATVHAGFDQSGTIKGSYSGYVSASCEATGYNGQVITSENAHAEISGNINGVALNSASAQSSSGSDRTNVSGSFVISNYTAGTPIRLTTSVLGKQTGIGACVASGSYTINSLYII